MDDVSCRLAGCPSVCIMAWNFYVYFVMGNFNVCIARFFFSPFASPLCLMLIKEDEKKKTRKNTSLWPLWDQRRSVSHKIRLSSLIPYCCSDGFYAPPLSHFGDDFLWLLLGLAASPLSLCVLLLVATAMTDKWSDLLYIMFTAITSHYVSSCPYLETLFGWSMAR